MRTRIRTKLASSILSLGILSAGILATAAPAPASADPLTADFDGNGYQDILLGNPRHKMYGVHNSGLIAVIHADSAGIHEGINGRWRRRNNGVMDPGDRMGEAVAVGDFNADGMDDAVVGVPGAWRSSYHPLYGSSGVGVGVVREYHGSEDGLSHSPNAELKASRSSFERFGQAFAVADFNQDGFDDVAVGAPGAYAWEDTGHPGSVTVFYGTSNGLRSYGIELIGKENRRTPGTFKPGDQFGMTLAAGDMDCNGHPDLAIGSPTAERFNGDKRAGRVMLVFFGRYGIINTRVINDLNESSNAGDEFGTSLAIGHFERNDGCADLAIGAKEKVGSATKAGMVTVLYNRPGRIGYRRELWHQGRSDIEGSAEKYDEFGASLAVADFDNNGIDDLAIGVPGETFQAYFPDRKNAGVLTVLYGEPSGLTVDSFASYWHQGRSGLEGKVEQYDRFAQTLSTGDYNNDGYPDLMIGIPYEAVGHSSATHGALQFLHGGYRGLRARRDELQTLHADNMTWGGGWDAAIPLSFIGLALP